MIVKAQKSVLWQIIVSIYDSAGTFQLKRVSCRPTAQMIRNRLSQIAQQEGLSLEANAIDQLVQATQSDIRQILTLLQTWNLRNKSMTYDESKDLTSVSKKNVDMGPFDLAGRLLNGSAFRGMSMEDKLGLYFTDYQLLPTFVQVFFRTAVLIKGKLHPHETLG